MRKTPTIVALALLSAAITAHWLHPRDAIAQPADPDGDDDNDPPDDDDDVPDPDDPGSDPPDAGGDPGGGGADPGDGGGGGDPGDGGDDGGGGSDPGGDLGPADDNGPAGGDDDGGAPGGSGGDDGSDDDGPAAPGGAVDDDGDDDDGPAAAGAGGGADDDDDDAPASGAPTGGDDDDDDDAPGASPAPGDDDDGGDDDSPGGGAPERGDDDPGGEIETTGGGEEDESERIRLDERDGIETDREGFRYRRNEFVALDLKPTDVARLQRDGYRVVKSDRLGSLAGTVHLLKSPARVRDNDALAQIETVADPATLGLNHLYDSSSARLRKTPGKPPVTRPACGCQIGLIDTGVAANLPAFRHAMIEQKAFSGPAVTPKLHGTAIAHLFSGTSPRPSRGTRVVVGDIFSGPRAESGSTYALVKALDWMAAKGVPVINVSLAGPRNPVVAATIEKLSKRGHLIVAAAGNDGPAAPPVFPGAYSGVVAVTAVDSGRQVYRYANRGNYVDFSAFGVNVPSIDPKGIFTSATGTSFAAPVVAARLAARMAKPDPRIAASLVADLEKSARDLGKPGRDTTFGHGLIDTGGQ